MEKLIAVLEEKIQECEEETEYTNALRWVLDFVEEEYIRAGYHNLRGDEDEWQ